MLSSRERLGDWIRAHVTEERLKRVERVLEEDSLYPPSELIDFNSWALPETVYRIHHDSFKAISGSESMATTSLEQLLYLFFDGEGESTELRKRFLKRLRSRKSTLYHYFMEVEKATKRYREWWGGADLRGYLDIRKDAVRLLGAAMFWYVTLLACIEVSKKALADERWTPGQLLTWDEAIASYVAYWFATRRELNRYVLL